jgi:prepilin-type N-terminal cleavage/methylation domain-containing protein
MKNKGFTLLELMIALSIFAAFSVFMYRFFGDAQRSVIAKHRMLDMQYNGAAALNYVENVIRNNSGIGCDSTEKRLYSGSVDNVLMDYSGSPDYPGINAKLFYDRASHALKDSSGNTLCSYIDDISVTIEGGSDELIGVTVKLSYGSGPRQIGYEARTVINTGK